MSKKIVRNGVPDVVNKEQPGHGYIFRKPYDGEEQELICLKIQEECQEIIDAIKNDDRQNIMEEIGDVFSLLHFICDNYGIRNKSIIDLQTLKQTKVGTFRDYWVMEKK